MPTPPDTPPRESQILPDRSLTVPESTLPVDTDAIPEPEGLTQIIKTDYQIGQDNVAPRYVLEFDFHQKVFTISALGVVGFTILTMAFSKQHRAGLHGLA